MKHDLLKSIKNQNCFSSSPSLPFSWPNSYISLICHLHKPVGNKKKTEFIKGDVSAFKITRYQIRLLILLSRSPKVLSSPFIQHFIQPNELYVTCDKVGIRKGECVGMKALNRFNNYETLS